MVSLLEVSRDKVNGNWAISEKYKGPELAKAVCRRRVGSCNWKATVSPQKENLRHGPHERDDSWVARNYSSFPREVW